MSSRPPQPALTAPQPIQPEHDVSRFDCGKPALSDWLRYRALKAEGRSARSYVVCTDLKVVGYYGIATSAVVHAAATAKLRQNMPDPIPAMILARLAVGKDFQGRGIGRGLMQDAFKRILAASQIVGTRCLLVHPIDQEAEIFYGSYGFSALPGGTKTLFLPLETLAKAI